LPYEDKRQVALQPDDSIKFFRNRPR